jgi:hypothetical protein
MLEEEKYKCVGGTASTVGLGLFMKLCWALGRDTVGKACGGQVA